MIFRKIDLDNFNIAIERLLQSIAEEEVEQPIKTFANKNNISDKSTAHKKHLKLDIAKIREAIVQAKRINLDF